MKNKWQRTISVLLIVMLLSVSTLVVYATPVSVSGSTSDGIYGGEVTSYAYQGIASMWAEPYDVGAEMYLRVSASMYDADGNYRESFSASGGNSCRGAKTSTVVLGFVKCNFYAESVWVDNATSYTG